ncbi:hypothetical protein BS47DRAFT_1341460 [Hydnum rufescens UP504]|uniref:Thioredoxin domain-containing protein n=1 Tax=Hydnum rufescens UP504 TaxID=1448309 RepID=A0A9P6DW01_9AGAM|nr:hypothetical protein BS47DRAFT_1341460 [Hydnum rufescens UP504]
MTFIENPLPSLLTTIGGLAPPPRPYLIFYADIVDGKMWCGYCRDVEELVKAQFTADDSVTGIVLRVGDKATWKNPKHEYRDPHGYGLTAIPTIVRLEEGKEVARLVEDDVKNESKLAEFLKE